MTRPVLAGGAWWSLAILLVVGGCRDAIVPSSDQRVGGPQLSSSGTITAVLEQAPTAPPLESYQVSFWGYQGKAATVLVNYQPVGSESVGHPFLRFDIPKGGLLGGANGTPLIKGDSVYITLTIDPVYFDVDFQPSGAKFSIKSPAVLTLWYGNANHDLNGNGVVDGYDQKLLDQLAIYYITSGAGSKLPSANDTTGETVSAPLLHFSTYAVSW